MASDEDEDLIGCISGFSEVCTGVDCDEFERVLRQAIIGMRRGWVRKIFIRQSRGQLHPALEYDLTFAGEALIEGYLAGCNAGERDAINIAQERAQKEQQ